MAGASLGGADVGVKTGDGTSGRAAAANGVGGGAGGDPKPPRAQSTVLLDAIFPQMSSAAGGEGGEADAGTDQSEAGVDAASG